MIRVISVEQGTSAEATMLCLVVLTVLLGSLKGAEISRANTHHVAPYTVPGTGVVNSAIANLTLHYNDNICLEILLTDCSKHVTQGDEIVCGSNGHTYDNHCHFAHVVCEYLHSQQHLSLKHSGACSVASSTAVPAAMTTTSGVTMTTGVNNGVTSGVSASSLKTTTVASTTMMQQTTTLMVTTTDPVNSIIANVFCQQMDSIDCSRGFNVVCASDRNLYPNDCEFSKAKCRDSSITLEPDVSRCYGP